jgi:hypothetical protein
MKLNTIVLATAFAMTGSLAFAQPAPIGSSADFGNGALINRGPVITTGEDLDFQTGRSYRAPSMRTEMGGERMHYRHVTRKHRHRHVAEDRR